MGSAGRFIAAELVVLAAAQAPARAQEPARPPHAEIARVCLNQWERRAAIEAGMVMRLAAAIYALKNRIPGTLLRARLCRGAEGLVYVLTILGHDGKVSRIILDAVKGTPVGGP